MSKTETTTTTTNAALFASGTTALIFPRPGCVSRHAGAPRTVGGTAMRSAVLASVFAVATGCKPSPIASPAAPTETMEEARPTGSTLLPEAIAPHERDFGVTLPIVNWPSTEKALLQARLLSDEPEQHESGQLTLNDSAANGRKIMQSETRRGEENAGPRTYEPEPIPAPERAVMVHWGKRTESSPGRLTFIPDCVASGQYRYRETTLALEDLGRYAVVNASAEAGVVRMGEGRADVQLGETERVLVGVRGVYVLEGHDGIVPSHPGCAEATHVLSAVGVGAHVRILDEHKSGGVSMKLSTPIVDVRVEGEDTAKLSVRSQAGSVDSCKKSGESGNGAQPSRNTALPECSSPLLVTLSPVRRDACKLQPEGLPLGIGNDEPIKVGECRKFRRGRARITIEGHIVGHRRPTKGKLPHGAPPKDVHVQIRVGPVETKRKVVGKGAQLGFAQKLNSASMSKPVAQRVGTIAVTDQPLEVWVSVSCPTDWGCTLPESFAVRLQLITDEE